MIDFLVRRWFLLSLALVIAFAFAAPHQMRPLAESMPRQWIVAGVLFLMALPLEIRAMWKVACRPLAPGLAIAMSFLLLPPLAWLVSPLLQEELSNGLIVATAVPCTLASAAVWTRRGGGNDSVALFVTVATNLTCFLVTPAWLKVLTARSVSLSFSNMVVHLTALVVFPIVLAQLLRVAEPVRRSAAKAKTVLAVSAQIGILAIVLVGAVDCGVRLSSRAEGMLTIIEWGTMTAAVVVLHLTALLGGFYLAQATRLPHADAQAVGIAGSQKTLMVGLDIAVEYYGGLAILPLVVYHVAQLLIDTVIADRWRGQQAAEKPS